MFIVCVLLYWHDCKTYNIAKPWNICGENNIEKIKIIVKLTKTTLGINDTKQNYKCNDLWNRFPYQNSLQSI